MRDYYHRAYGATAAALYGVVVPRWTWESLHPSLREGEGEPPEHVSGV
jgi:hypothetical protein